ncbi:S-(hydroxymethyl)glutathione dehydrogenase, partial [Geodia barretti]
MGGRGNSPEPLTQESDGFCYQSWGKGVTNIAGTKARAVLIQVALQKGEVAMYVIRRIAKAQPGKVWQVANLLIKICAAYEENGRPKAQVYVSQGLPGTPNVAYAEWTQATIEPNWPSQAPFSIAAENVPDPELQHPNDGIVKITSSCICGSDLHMYEGRTATLPSNAS